MLELLRNLTNFGRRPNLRVSDYVSRVHPGREVYVQDGLEKRNFQTYILSVSGKTFVLRMDYIIRHADNRFTARMLDVYLPGPTKTYVYLSDLGDLVTRFEPHKEDFEQKFREWYSSVR